MAELLLGPMVRHTDGRGATIWVETDRPCEVEILGRSTPTVTAFGHHFGFVEVGGFEPGSSTPYEVHLDGRRVWPDLHDVPPSVLRMPRTDRLQVAFGSCRTAVPQEEPPEDADRVDALLELARWVIADPTERLPDLLVMLGDQVYADVPGPVARTLVRRRRATDSPLDHDASRFDDFAELYRDAWSEPAVRWLLSCVPSALIFDDHEIIDNWNTSYSWVDERRGTEWWSERAVNGLAAYWLYQHLGNLSPAERDDDPRWRALSERGDEQPARSAFAERADHAGQPSEDVRWSYSWSVGPLRLAMVDVRDARLLDENRRQLLDDGTWRWLAKQMAGDERHMLVATSLPVLLAPGVDDLERWITALCDGAWGRGGVVLGDKIRQATQFSHWPSFPGAVDRLLGLIHNRLEWEGPTPKTVGLISGDVHYSYLARLDAWADGSPVTKPVYQATSSPLCYDLEHALQGLSRLSVSPAMRPVARRLAAAAGVPREPYMWELQAGPVFHNVVSLLDLDDSGARLRLLRTSAEGAPGERLDEVVDMSYR